MKRAALNKLLKITKRFIRLRALGHLWNALEKLHYADVAELIDASSLSERGVIVKLYFDKNAIKELAEVISEVKPENAVEILSSFKIENIAEVFEELSSDDAAELISFFDENFQNEILKIIDSQDSEDIQEQLAYPEKSAGRVMSSDFLALEENTSASNAISAIQLAAEEVDVPFYLYVTDGENKLKGVLSLKQLILASPGKKIKEIMNTDVLKVDAFTDQEEVATLVADYNLLAMPVVDENDDLVGVVTVDDIIDIIQNEATEDIYKLAGIQEGYSIELPIKESLKKRIPWLFTSLLTTSLTAFIISQFQVNIVHAVVLAVLMPMVGAIGGVIGNQTVAIFVRELVLENIEWKNSKKIILKELGVSTISGLIIGIVTCSLITIIFKNFAIGLIFSTAILLNLFNGTLFGSVIPVVLKKLKLDPALASGLVVTMLTDSIGIFTFLGLAALFKNYINM